MPDTLIDSWPTSKYNTNDVVGYYWGYYAGQSFNCTAACYLEKCLFYLAADAGNIPQQPVHAYLYAMTGTYGSTSIPTGSPLAISDSIAGTSLPTTLSLVTFTFSGANMIALSAYTHYVIVLEYDNAHRWDGDISYYVDNTGNAPGNGCKSTNGTSWTYVTNDMIFYVYGVASLPSTLSILCGVSDANLKAVNKLVKANVSKVENLTV